MTLPAWAEVTTALLTPTIAVAGSLLAYQNHQLAKKRRKDELFDRRYAFYQRVRDAWVSMSNVYSLAPSRDELDLLAQEAEFLFGRDIASHIRSLEKRETVAPEFFSDEGFARPFAKYLRLEDQ